MNPDALAGQRANPSEPSRWSATDLLHVLAQLPDEVSLDLSAPYEQRSALCMLARAYGVEERVTMLVSSTGMWQFQGARSDAPASVVAGSSEVTFPPTMGEAVELLAPGDVEVSSTKRDDTLLADHRVAIVTNLPSHYRIPLFTELAARLESAGGALKVFFLGRESPGRPWLAVSEGLEFDHEFLTSLRVRMRRHRAPLLPLNLGRRLKAYRPTILIAAGFSPFSSIEAALYSSRHQIPLGLWSGEIPSLAARRRPRALRIAERSWLLRRADFGIAYGSLAERYLRTMTPDLPVVIGRNSSVSESTPRDRDRDDADIQLLAVADTSLPGKGIDILEEALMLLETPCRLTVIGGGSAGGATRDERIRFLGAVPHHEVKDRYRRSDLFLFPSQVDPFGLALVEAMASDLPVVASRASGAVADLAVSGWNSLLVEDLNARSWAEQIRAFASDERLRRALGKRAGDTVRRRWTIRHAAEAMMAGLRLGALRGSNRRGQSSRAHGLRAD